MPLWGQNPDPNTGIEDKVIYLIKHPIHRTQENTKEKSLTRYAKKI